MDPRPPVGRKRNRRRRSGRANNCWSNDERALFERLWKGTFQAILTEQHEETSTSAALVAAAGPSCRQAKCCSCCCHNHPPHVRLLLNSTKNTFASVKGMAHLQSHLIAPIKSAARYPPKIFVKNI